MNQKFKLLTLLSLFVSISSFGMEEHEPKQLEIKKTTLRIDGDNEIIEEEVAFLVDPESSKPLILKHWDKYKIGNKCFVFHRDCMGGASLMHFTGNVELSVEVQEMGLLRKAGKEKFFEGGSIDDDLSTNGVFVKGGHFGETIPKHTFQGNEIESFLARNDGEEESSKS